MISIADLKSIGRARLNDAKVLLKGRRLDGAVYLCGYAVEMALKARLCRTLKWSGFPETGAEFQGLQSVKTHNLEILLRLSGVEGKIRTRFILGMVSGSRLGSRETLPDIRQVYGTAGKGHDCGSD